MNQLLFGMFKVALLMSASRPLLRHVPPVVMLASYPATNVSPNRSASAIIVTVGFAQPPVGNTLLLATYRFGLSWTRQFASTTPVLAPSAHAGSAHVVIAAYRLGEIIFRGTI